MKGFNYNAITSFLWTGVVILLTPLFFQSCQPQKGKADLYKTLSFQAPSTDSLSAPAPSPGSSSSDNGSIYYGIYSPAEVSGIFEKKHMTYNPDILSPLKNPNEFTTKTQIALNLGVYGADLSYIQMFDAGGEAPKYLNVILKLAGQLGIPGDYISGLVKRMDNNVSNSDSLMQISIEAFNHVNKFLMAENAEDMAYLILAGAWVEAMYITAHDLMKDNDPYIIRKIIEQKFSLNYLLSSMKNYYNDTNVAYVYRRLFVLKKYLDKTNMEFHEKTIHVDKENKEIQATPENVRFSPETMNKIREIIFELRNQILNK